MSDSEEERQKRLEEERRLIMSYTPRGGKKGESFRSCVFRRNRTKSALARMLDRGLTVLCFYCRVALTAENATVDHWTARSMGGSDSELNRVWACDVCNRRKADLSGEEFMALLNKEREEKEHGQHLPRQGQHGGQA